MSDKKLTIPLSIDRSEAKAATDATKVDLAQLEQAVLKVANSLDEGMKKWGRASKESARESRREFKQMVDAQLKGMNDLLDSFIRQQQAAKENTSQLSKMAVAMYGIQKGTEFARMYTAALREAVDYNNRITKDLIAQRDAERELQMLRGKNSTGGTALESRRFAVETGMTASEQQAFRTAFMGSGAQFVGRNITGDQSESLQRMVAKMSTTTGISPDVMGDLTGRVLGQTDYTKMGERGPGEALRRIGGIMAILQEGSGDNAPLLTQQVRAMSTLLNEDASKGVFTDPNEVAAVISTLAEFNPQEAASSANSAIRGLRDFEGKPKSFLRRAGVTPQTPTMEAIERVAKLADEEAAKSGVKPMDVLRKNFEDIQTVNALATLSNKGVGPGGILAQRMDIAKQTTAESVRADIDKAANDPQGAFLYRQAQARVDLAEGERAERRLMYETLREQGKAEAIRRGEIGTPQEAVGNMIWDSSIGVVRGLMYGFKGSREERLDDAAIRELRQRSEAAGGVLSEEDFGELQRTRGTTGAEAAFQKAMDKMQQAGVNPLAQAADAMNRVANALEAKQPPVMTKATPGGGRAQAPR